MFYACLLQYVCWSQCCSCHCSCHYDCVFIITRFWCIPTHVQSKRSSDFALDTDSRSWSTKLARINKTWILSNSWVTGWCMELKTLKLEYLNAFQRYLDFMSLNTMKCTAKVTNVKQTCLCLTHAVYTKCENGCVFVKRKLQSILATDLQASAT